MKSLLRFCSLFLCFLLLFTVFSVSVSAREYDAADYGVYQETWVQSDTFSGNWFAGVDTGVTAFSFVPYDGYRDYQEATLTMKYNDLRYNAYYYSRFTVSLGDDRPILEQGVSYSLNISNIYNSLLVHTSPLFYARKPAVVSVAAVSYGYVYEYAEVTQLQSSTLGEIIDLSATITPSKNARAIEIVVKVPISTNLPTYTYNADIKLTSYWGEFNGDESFQVSIKEESTETGLLKGVVQWLKNIRDGISNVFSSIGELPNKIKEFVTSGFNNVVNGITNIFNNIKELPNKLWGLIENGLKSLFIPSQDYIVKFKNDMQEMLSAKLGAVYQVLDISFNSWDRIMVNDELNYIQIPKTTIKVSNTDTFTFGGVEVPIVPSGFEFLANIIKTLVGIVCTILFVNGLRNRYDELMGVEK